MWLFVQCFSIALCEYYWFFIQVYNTLNKRDRTVNRSTRCVKQQQIFVFVLYNFFFCASKNVYDKIERKNRYTNLILFRDELFCSFAFTMRCMCVSVWYSQLHPSERDLEISFDSGLRFALVLVEAETISQEVLHGRVNVLQNSNQRVVLVGVTLQHTHRLPITRFITRPPPSLQIQNARARRSSLSCSRDRSSADCGSCVYTIKFNFFTARPT
jgi:hypothetical protein